MNEEFQDVPSDVRVRIVQPKQKDFNVVGVSHPMVLNNPVDTNYDQLIKNNIDFLNKQEAILSRDKKSLASQMQDMMKKQEIVEYNGQRVNRLFHSLNFNRKQESIDLFEEFNAQKGNYFVFDIETFGDSQERNKAYGISEISLNQYDVDGNLVDKSYNTVIRQDKETIDSLQKRINDLKSDKYLFNKLEGWEQRSLVDLMRYSTHMDENDEQAFKYNKKEKSISHHSIIKSVFNEKDQLDGQKVLRYMDDYLEYMQSGLNNLKSNGTAGKTAISKVAKIMNENADKFFISFNGNNFDMPVLQAFAKAKGVELPEGTKHLDYLNVIKTAYFDSDDLKKSVLDGQGKSYDGGPFSKDKLAAFVHAFIEDNNQDEAHNAQVDVDNTAKVVAITRDPIQQKIQNAETNVKQGFNYHPTEMSWNGDPLYNGQKLFASGGIQAFKEGDESFRTSLDENGKWVADSNGFNKTVISSKSFYEFAGHHMLEDGKQAFAFYSPDANEYSYVVRKGEHAFAELQDFVQSRFYNWDKVDPKLKREITHGVESDRARRRYDRYFSMDGGGNGLTLIDGEIQEKGTAGFSGLKRMLANAQIMEEHLNSNGSIYRQAVEENIANGMSKNQAKRAARKVRSHELIDLMDFHSLWDDKSKKYVFNKKEQDHFFKMYKRLIDETPYLNEAVTAIDERYKLEIESASQIGDHYQRREKLREINQKRDQAIMRYQQATVNQVGSPVQETKLKLFEDQRLSWFDGELGDSRTINFETAATARDNIYGYAKRGIDEGPHKQQLMKERMFNLVENLRSQNKINQKQHQSYINLIHENESVWNSSTEIAVDMRNKNGGKYETTRKEPTLLHNENIKTLNETLEKKNLSQSHLIQQAINDTDNAELLMNDNAVKGKKLILGDQMKETLDILDQQRFSGLNPNNYQAIEDLVTSIHKTGKNRHISMTLDDQANMKLFVYDAKDSISVQNQLQRGTAPSKAVEIQMPLINESGTHKIGGQVLNAHSFAKLEGKKVNVISSAQHISEGYTQRMGAIMKRLDDGDIEGATLLSKRTLRSQIENMSGIQRNMVGENDNYNWANNESDMDKQSHIKVANAMVEDLYYNHGKDGFEGLKLTKSDFYDPDDAFRVVNGVEVLRPGLTLDDINMDKSYAMLSKMTSWAEKSLDKDVFSSSIKAEHFSNATVSMLDVRESMPYGTFYNHGRDNAVQYKNVYTINEATNERIQNIKGVSRKNLLKTERQIAYEEGRGNSSSMNVKTAYMTQNDLHDRLNQLMETKDGKALLGELNLIREDGTLDPIKTPRLYEQQGILANDLADALEVDNEKRFEKGNQFKPTKGLDLGSTVKPGDILGIRTFDNGTRKEIRYEGTKEATIISGIKGNNDLVLRWQSDPFKYMLDGEKMTDTIADRRLITALTGREDVSAIINPDVTKHKDFGMLMAGEARLMAEEVNGLSGERKARAIEIIEGGKIGLKWDDQMNGFVDGSFDLDIKKDQFNKVFEQLQQEGFDINPETNTGVRVGILDMRMSKVSNYSKVVDGVGAGQQVLGFNEDGTKIYGSQGGVQWGHREMGILKSNGMEKTYQHVYDVMKEKSKRLDEVEGLKTSLKYMMDEHATVEALSVQDFNRLPENYRNEHTYKGTIFDSKQSIMDKFAGNAAVNDHGFWMELPGVQNSKGELNEVKVNLGSGGEKTINKIFVPFTAAEGADGDIHLRDLQKKISNIYKRAEEVNTAGSVEEARTAQKGLQSAVTSYMKQSFKELSSSQGMLFEDVFKASMGGETNGIKTSSASGLFKLMDPEMSERFGKGEFTVISESMAKKMGVYDQLKNGDELFASNVRYPSFHDGAMQFSQLRMDSSIRDGEIHTSSFASMLQNADSDGDYSHITVVEDKDIQQEWKNKHDEREQKLADDYQRHREKVLETNGDRKPAPDLVNTNEGSYIGKQSGNSAEQAAAKIGKMTIGRASNLNLFIRQIADYNYDPDSEINQRMKSFGSALEQKLIDAKHGAKPAGLDMIDAIYAGKWDKAMDIDNQYFNGMFQEKYFMNDVALEMPMALQSTQNGLKTRGLKFGTSTGIQYDINANHGVEDFINLLDGSASRAEMGGDNKALGLYHKHLRDAGHELDIDQQETIERIEGNKTTTMKKVSETRHNLQTRASDLVNNGLSTFKNKVNQTWDSVKGMSGKKKMLLGGGIAIGALTGYNILNTEKPVMPYNEDESNTQTQELPSENQNPSPPRPAISMPQGEHYATQQNASITIQASGGDVDQDQLSHAVSEGMRSSNMNAGATRISVNHQDNTQQLNRQWYRDKVRENI